MEAEQMKAIRRRLSAEDGRSGRLTVGAGRLLLAAHDEMQDTIDGLRARLAPLEAEVGAMRARIDVLDRAIDPALRGECGCCRRCGPAVPCGLVIETLGESCVGACSCTGPGLYHDRSGR